MITKLALSLVGFYQKFISPFKPRSCRYYPSCSEYAKWQFETNGFWRALFASILRILRCNKLFVGGIDYPEIDFKKPSLLELKKGEPRIKYFIVPLNKKFAVVKKIFKST